MTARSKHPPYRRVHLVRAALRRMLLCRGAAPARTVERSDERRMRLGARFLESVHPKNVRSFMAPAVLCGSPVGKSRTRKKSARQFVSRWSEDWRRPAMRTHERRVALLLDALQMFPDEALPLCGLYRPGKKIFRRPVRMQSKAARSAQCRREYYRKQGWEQTR